MLLSTHTRPTACGFRQHSDAGKCIPSINKVQGQRTMQNTGNIYNQSNARKRVIAQVQTPVAPVAPVEIEVEDVPVTTRILPVNEDVLCLRHICNQRLKFEVEYALKRGTTDNTYLFKGDDGKLRMLLDVPTSNFADCMVAALKGAGDLSGLKTVVISHLTVKRMGSLKALLKLLSASPGIINLYLSNPGLQLLRASLSDEEDAKLLENVMLHAVKPGATLTLTGPQDPDVPPSEGPADLRLILTSTPRWPDCLALYMSKHRLLFTSKIFSAHVSPEMAMCYIDENAEDVFDDGGWDIYGRDWQYFFECNLAPVAGQLAGILERLNINFTPEGTKPVLGLEAGWLVDGFKGFLQGFGLKGGAAKSDPVRTALPSTSGLSVEAIAPLHGPVIKYSVGKLLRNYGKWTTEEMKKTEECGVLVLYASAYGNTALLAQAISRGITKAGVGVTQLNLELCTPRDVQDALAKCRGFCIGSPTLGGHMPTQVQTALGTILAAPEAVNLPAAVFGSFGWSGEAVDEMEQKLKDAGFQFGFESIRCKFKPTQQMLQLCEESGTDLGQLVLKKKRISEKSAMMPARSLSVIGGTGAQAALGRVVGCLCVVTAKLEDAQSAMLASWISQASFDPPGLTIAVKKDRAIEPLLQNGAKFVVNILAEGKDRPVIKHLLKPFKPGEDRFEGIACYDSEVSGCKVLEDSAAYLECEMTDRLEAGDHYILYAKVDTGKVMLENALSSVHHRKIGTTY